jgi:hypothetical protein
VLGDGHQAGQRLGLLADAGELRAHRSQLAGRLGQRLERLDDALGDAQRCQEAIQHAPGAIA